MDAYPLRKKDRQMTSSARTSAAKGTSIAGKPLFPSLKRWTHTVACGNRGVGTLDESGPCETTDHGPKPWQLKSCSSRSPSNATCQCKINREDVILGCVTQACSPRASAKTKYPGRVAEQAKGIWEGRNQNHTLEDHIRYLLK